MMTFLPITKALDADGDGEISAKEIENAVAALKKLDKNKDGKITEDEIRPERRGMGGGPPGNNRRGGFGGPPGESSDRRGFGGPLGEGRGGFSSQGGQGGRPGPNEMVAKLMALDSNKDGKLAKDEVSGRMHAIIDRADTNKDGYADKAELTKMAQERMGGGQGGRGGFGGRPGGRGGEGGFGGRGGQGGGTARPARPEFDN
tara:strand:- start:6643 stop:7248 length:606 start_codon:yes stop_codon:yes gene_type:complete